MGLLSFLRKVLFNISLICGAFPLLPVHEQLMDEELCSPDRLGALIGFLLEINPAIRLWVRGSKPEPSQKERRCSSHLEGHALSITQIFATPLFVREESASLLPKGAEVQVFNVQVT